MLIHDIGGTVALPHYWAPLERTGSSNARSRPVVCTCSHNSHRDISSQDRSCTSGRPPPRLNGRSSFWSPSSALAGALISKRNTDTIPYCIHESQIVAPFH